MQKKSRRHFIVVFRVHEISSKGISILVSVLIGALRDMKGRQVAVVADVEFSTLGDLADDARSA